jgi:hypothetical protein
MILQITGTEEDVEPKTEIGIVRSSEEKKKTQADITYGIDDIPPWYLCIFMALQVRCLRNYTIMYFLMYAGE